MACTMGLLFGAAATAQLDGFGLVTNGPFASLSVNPAYQPDHLGDFHCIGLTGARIAAGHTAFSYSGAVDRGTVDMDAVLHSLDPVNHLFADIQLPLLGGGIRAGQAYFRAGMRTHVEQRLGYPEELIELLWKGNGHPDVIGRSLSLDGLSLNAVAYSDVYAGASVRLLKEQLNLGGTVHILSGTGVVHTSQGNLDLFTDPQTYSLHASGNFLVQTAGAFALDSAAASPLPGDFLPGSGNPGMAFDFGATVRLGKVTVEAAALNWGWIDWEQQARQYVMDETAFTFSGFDLHQLLSTKDSTAGVIQQFVDSLTTAFAWDTADATFRTPTSGMLQCSARMKSWRNGQAYAGWSLRQRLGHSFTGMHAGLIQSLGRALILQCGVQWFDQDQWLVSGGFRLRAGPAVFHAATENVPGIINLAGHRYWQGTAGITFAIGRQEKLAPTISPNERLTLPAAE